MDEVDFTILSATSVLADLIEKCPPAEACRDAFDRMSKATVQMCMSTTGFSSSSAHGLNARKGSEDYFGAPSTSQFATSNARGSRPSKQQTGTRPTPSFDMGLNDIFPAPSPGPSGTAPMYPPPQATNNGSRNTIKNEYANDAYSVPRHQTSSPTAYSAPGGISPSPRHVTTTDNSAIDPSLLPSAQQSAINQNLQPYTSPLTASNISQNDMYGTNYENFDFSAIDFMQGGNPNFGGAATDGGFDLGFGMGWDGQDHDFSEGGGQLDLFDGFFFGGNGGAGY